MKCIIYVKEYTISDLCIYRELYEWNSMIYLSTTSHVVSKIINKKGEIYLCKLIYNSGLNISMSLEI